MKHTVKRTPPWNFGRLVLGSIDADFRKQVALNTRWNKDLVRRRDWKPLTRSTRFTLTLMRLLEKRTEASAPLQTQKSNFLFLLCFHAHASAKRDPFEYRQLFINVCQLNLKFDQTLPNIGQVVPFFEEVWQMWAPGTNAKNKNKNRRIVQIWPSNMSKICCKD